MSGKPLFYAVAVPNYLAVEYACRISVETEDADDLQSGIMKMLALPEEDLYRIGQNEHKTLMENFNYKALTKKLDTCVSK